MKIEGRNAVSEALKSGKTIDRVLVAEGNTDGSAKVLYAKLKDAKIKVQVVKRAVLDKESETGRHQGFIAFATDFVYSSVDDILEYAKQKGEDPLIVILDSLEDPHNLGSIIRSSEVFGVHGIIIGKHRSVSVNDTVIRVSEGASEYVKVAKVVNINTEIEKLKKQGLWVIGADMDGENIAKSDLKGGIALVIGGENVGISPLTRKLCDKVVKIPMKGKINSLNASVAAGICLYEASKVR
ncbi:MAG: 23S rRNA (guanosine(2251)-2'-O)-methyltransferase RlmB [Clostridia bacterium]|nr:23S rRNA (guanosine(2251)-2'-O)-methyltransferase RlmB [Clostridia bacterium]MBR2070052.1 23S rRNA (guanosine(2251)-2'-O)-methyltransferase RlmB [Clostridia bacterium]MBR2160236.1 23S rRNA (guanosine(2251)-2'-O)-methyltransferase RlmB [Clostridia bacterium]MBR2323836.1 23S rRNA (guanosine(2251)-2'-O)-methyltransferase RlmB [Clostridia bacterium]MBR2397811.1 23S rRNA (guanosine(2251)-2'-O)-methyltransferase RlmB [Clostridia bacterium]